MDAIDKINQLLYQKGMSGAELSRLIGVSNSVYSQWNTRTTKPSRKSLLKVANVFGVEVSCLLPDKEERPDLIEEIGPSKAALLDAVEDMTEAERLLLLEHIARIKSLRG